MTQLVAGHLNIQQDTIPELNPSYRLLLGPGPCNVDPRILRIAPAPTWSTLRQNSVLRWKQMSLTRHLEIPQEPKYLLPPSRKPLQVCCNRWRSWSVSPMYMVRSL